jgi:hypothetical protein
MQPAQQSISACKACEPFALTASLQYADYLPHQIHIAGVLHRQNFDALTCNDRLAMGRCSSFPSIASRSCRMNCPSSATCTFPPMHLACIEISVSCLRTRSVAFTTVSFRRQQLWLSHNQIRFLPYELYRMTALTELLCTSNPLMDLPPVS